MNEVSTCIPFVSEVILKKITPQRYIQKPTPLDTGRKLNVHKTFRRRPGRLLNVLCTFNLRSVCRGYISPVYLFYRPTYDETFCTLDTGNLAYIRRQEDALDIF